MTEILAWFVVGFAILRLIVSLLNYLPGFYLRRGEVSGSPLVSVLIPARNEEAVLSGLLESLTHQAYLHLEILVYDDQSTDKTALVVREQAAVDKRIRCFSGAATPLPEGWMGKNHACHRLAMEAGGDFLLFLDADVALGQGAVRDAVSLFQRQGIHLLSIFPRQEMKTTGEKLTVPLMNWVLLSMLPLSLVRNSRIPSLSAANGQFMMFRADSYRKNRWHEKVRSHPVEDILIARLVKKTGLQMMTLLGRDDVRCRMYGGYREALHGFSKNVNQYLGGFTFTLVLFSLLVLAGWIPVIFSFTPALFVTFVITLLLVRVFVSLSARQPVIMNLLYHPLQLVSWLLITIQWFRNRRNRQIFWKDRPVRL